MRPAGSGAGRATALAPGELEGARRARLPATLAPQLTTLVEQPPAGDEWLHEIKLDGYRLLTFLEDGEARLLTRKGEDWTGRLRPLAEAVASEIPASTALLDGEVVVLEPNGTTSFAALQAALAEKRPGSLTLFLFDLLHLDGWDLRRVPLGERKRLLHRLVPTGADGSGRVRYTDHVEGRGEAFHRRACRLRLEGVVSKRRDARYRSGRGHDWLKAKCLARQELVIGGFSEPSGARAGLGALLLGVHEDGRLVYAGRCGTGFTAAALAGLRRRLDRLERATPPFADPPTGAEARGVHWVRPEVVCEVEFTEWTEDGRLRHPSFRGLREDKDAAEVVRERPRPGPAGAPAAAAPREATPPGPRETVEVGGVRLTHAGRRLWQGTGLTKLDLALYYQQIGETMLPHVARRPLSLLRCPQGSAGGCFFQKHVGEQFPEAVGRVAIREREDRKPELYAVVETVAGLLGLVQMGVLEIHVWGARSDRLERPDRVVFDLDPDVGLAWERVIETALFLRFHLAELGLQSFVGTTGGKGLHVVVPLLRRHGWDEVKAFARAVAADLVRREPGKYTDNARKDRRRGRVFVDYLRNGRGATFIAPFSSRARSGAPVAVPISWEELRPDLRSDAWSVATLPRRLERLGEDPWREIGRVRQSITREVRRELGLEG